MSERLRLWLTRALIALAGFVVMLDWTLPPSITLIFDELALFGIVCAMKWLYRKAD